MFKYGKRLLSLVLCLVMALSLLPTLALAETGEAELIAEGTATFKTTAAAFKGETVIFTPESSGSVTVEILSCQPGYYVDTYVGGDWFDEFADSQPGTLSFEVTKGSEVELIICSYQINSDNPMLNEAAAGSVSYKVIFISNGEDDPDQGGDEPEDLVGSTPENPKLLGGTPYDYIPGNTTIWYLYDNYQNMVDNGVYVMVLHMKSGVEYTVTYQGEELPVDENGFLNFEMEDTDKQGQYLFSVTNNSEEESFFTIEVKDRPQYIDSGETLRMGRNTIKLNDQYLYTLYEFTPTRTGIYRITVTAGVVGDWGMSFNPQDHTTDKTTTLEWTCTAVGQHIMLGFTGAKNAYATITRIGDYVPVVEIPYTVYENTYDFSYQLPEDAQMVDIDLLDGNVHTAVLGEDGFYHYGSAEGPLMVANLQTIEINLQDGYTNGGLRAWLLDEAGETISKVDYNEAMYAYYQAGLVPVTQELATMIWEVGTAKGWWAAEGFIFGEEVPADLSVAWMQLCGYLESVEVTYTVSGTVTGGKNTTGTTTVELWAEGGEEAAYTVTTEDGSYTIESVAPGNYTVKFSKANHVTREYALTVEEENVTLNGTICLLGDANGDGTVNILDVAKAYAHVKGTKLTDDYAIACADVKGGGSIAITDVAALYAHFKGATKLY